MDIVNLQAGEPAPDDRDCITVERLPDGQYILECSALMACADDDYQSVSVIGGDLYPTYEAAEAAGLAWAAERCVEQIYVSRVG